MGIQINGQTDTISAADGSLTVSGADFTSISAGTTSTPSISPTGDSNTGIFFPAADTIAFAEGGVEAARFDSSGRLGIGTDNPSNLIHLYSTSDGAELLQLEIGGQPANTEKGKIIWRATQTNGQSAKLTSIGATAISGWGGEFQIFTKPANGTPNDTIVERVRVDNAGRVTMPYQPGCSVWYSGTDITSGTIVYDEVEFNTGSHYSTVNGRFTAPIAGRYLVLVNHLANSASSVGFRLYKNGSAYTAYWGYNDGGTTNKPVHFSVAVSLAASDYLTVVWANGTILGSANYHNAFTVYLLG